MDLAVLVLFAMILACPVFIVLWLLERRRRKAIQKRLSPAMDAAAEVEKLNSEAAGIRTSIADVRSTYLQMRNKQSGTKDWTLYDLKRTFRSSLAELGYDLDPCERMIASSRGSLVERYDRSTLA